MLEQIAKAAEAFRSELDAAKDARSLDELRVRYFGRKGGLIPTFFSQLKDVAKEQKKEVGDALNKLRTYPLATESIARHISSVVPSPHST